eukprot:TRINITY_DN5178_c0_g1_i1.p1 TRINITY_DN5178_c0_g1~~TRINITY_DN5178_c0_g1_i1.p1  ORF type:complete len:571 (+),score=53.15 TRINITY_DN5178_c0_g1_i1:199-1911(+)
MEIVSFREMGNLVCVKGFSYLGKACLINFILQKVNEVVPIIGPERLSEFFHQIFTSLSIPPVLQKRIAEYELQNRAKRPKLYIPSPNLYDYSDGNVSQLLRQYGSIGRGRFLSDRAFGLSSVEKTSGSQNRFENVKVNISGSGPGNLKIRSALDRFENIVGYGTAIVDRYDSLEGDRNGNDVKNSDNCTILDSLVRDSGDHHICCDKCDTDRFHAVSNETKGHFGPNPMVTAQPIPIVETDKLRRQFSSQENSVYEDYSISQPARPYGHPSNYEQSQDQSYYQNFCLGCCPECTKNEQNWTVHSGCHSGPSHEQDTSNQKCGEKFNQNDDKPYHQNSVTITESHFANLDQNQDQSYAQYNHDSSSMYFHQRYGQSYSQTYQKTSPTYGLESTNPKKDLLSQNYDDSYHQNSYYPTHNQIYNQNQNHQNPEHHARPSSTHNSNFNGTDIFITKGTVVQINNYTNNISHNMQPTNNHQHEIQLEQCKIDFSWDICNPTPQQSHSGTWNCIHSNINHCQDSNNDSLRDTNIKTVSSQGPEYDHNPKSGLSKQLPRQPQAPLYTITKHETYATL